MRKPQQTGVKLVGIVIVALLVAWLVSNQMKKQRLIARLTDRSPSVRVAAARTLLETGSLGGSLAMLPTPTRVRLAEALGEIHTAQSLHLLDLLLKDQEEEAQRAAADALAKQGARAYPVLMAALPVVGNTKDQAVRALVALGQPSVPRLRMLLDDSAASAAAQEALARIGGTGTDVLVQAAHCADPVLRGGAIANLALQKRPEALQAALDNLSLTDPLAQIVAAIAGLGVLGDRAATPALLPFLARAERATAASSLGMIADSRGVEPILAQFSAGDVAYRQAAVLALSRIGAPAAPALVHALASPDPALRLAAAEALGGAKSPLANAALVAALSDPNPQLRVFAVRALGWPGNAAAVAPLVRVLQNRAEYRVVDAAVLALGEIGPAGLPGLVEAVAAPGEDNVVRFQIARAMTMIGPEATPQLVAALSSPNPEVQKWTATALGNLNGRLGDQRAVAATIAGLRRLGRSSQGDVRWIVEEQLRLLTGSTKF